MSSKKVTSKSSAASDAYTGPITRSRSKGITQPQDQGSTIARLKEVRHIQMGHVGKVKYIILIGKVYFHILPFFLQ
ncbi:uncharacterized protein E5676_scaffold398G00110 [Cucumis melo var. makuwa]|uniref:Ty3-gypsy retrotransposon protein n=1 Tax=Cucumis melo var. makuwa TaxID=1194695 RepID=A0A5D3E7S7_CUCMM|nr:uncharacterized protein E5676_scaffold398G00110 [Cucumis melo var. makuwa]